MGWGPGEENQSKKRRAGPDDELEGEQRLTKQLKHLQINPITIRVRHKPLENRSSSCADYMPLDETKDRIVIHDLDYEIAQIEADEPKSFLLPDIDKKFSAIPQMLLRNRSDAANTQMVLYQVPSSISVPEEQDHVRKAIIAARKRVREKQAEELENTRLEKSIAMDNDYSEESAAAAVMDDPDAMDLG